MPFGGSTGSGTPGGDAKSRQITIAEMLLVTAIVAVVLGVLRMVPGGYTEHGAFLGFLVGLFVLCMLRPGRAINQVALWVMIGFVTAHVALQPNSADRGFLVALQPNSADRWFVGFVSLIALLWVVDETLCRQSVGSRRARSLIFRRLWWSVVGVCMLLFMAFDWTGPSVGWWLPLILYALATAAGLWRLLRWSDARPSQ